MLLSSVMSDGFKVFRAWIADSKVGIASAKSLSHSSFIAWAAAAASFAIASSAATTWETKQPMITFSLDFF